MSTLTVCPYCGEAMRFDEMKRHFSSCEGRSPVAASQPRRNASPSPSPAKVKPVSGLEFYNQLNKLSQLTRAKSRSGSNPAPSPFATATSPPHFPRQQQQLQPSEKEDATVRQLMFPSASLTIDVAPSRSPTSASLASSSSYHLQHDRVGEEAQRRPSRSWGPPSTASGVSPLAAPPPAPPAVRVDLSSAVRSSSDAGDTDGRGRRAGLSHSSSAQGSEAVRGGGLSSRSSRSPSRGAKSERGKRHGGKPALSSVGPSSRRSTTEGIGEPLQASHQYGDTQSDPEQSHRLEPYGGTRGEQRSNGPIKASSTDSVASSQRPPAQHSSFAIRLRSSGSSAAEPHNGPSHHPSAATQSSSFPAVGAVAAPSPSPELQHTVSALAKSLQHVQQLVERQQEQYNALLTAHADLTRQVAAQEGAVSGVLRRTTDQAGALEASLQQHARQWRQEHSMLNESVAALWANVSAVQAEVHAHSQLTVGGDTSRTEAIDHEDAPARVGVSRGAPLGVTPLAVHGAAGSTVPAAPPLLHGSTASASAPPPITVLRTAGEESSAYYSDIASFIQRDPPVLSASASTMLNHSGAGAPPIHVHQSALQHVSSVPASSGPTRNAVLSPPAAPASVSSRHLSSATSSVLPAAYRAPTQPRTAAYAMDVQHHHLQQQTAGRTQVSIEDRVVAMLHAKPTVVVPRSPWR